MSLFELLHGDGDYTQVMLFLTSHISADLSLSFEFPLKEDPQITRNIFMQNIQMITKNFQVINLYPILVHAFPACPKLISSAEKKILPNPEF